MNFKKICRNSVCPHNGAELNIQKHIILDTTLTKIDEFQDLSRAYKVKLFAICVQN